MKVLVISDVHGNLNIIDRIFEDNLDADIKIYLGDFQTSREKQIKYSEMFDYVVTGNCDYPGISDNTLFIELNGVKTMITHGHYFGSFLSKIDFSQLYFAARERQCSLILHGHDHIAVHEIENGINRFNPGSTTFPRGSHVPTYGIIEISDNFQMKFKHTNI